VGPSGEIAAIADSTTPQIVIGSVRMTRAKPFVAALSPADRKTLRSRPRLTFDASRVPPRLWIGIYQSARGRRDDPLALRAIGAQGAQALIRTGASATATARALARARGLRSAIIGGADMVAPEPARAAALRGADLLVWLQPPARLAVLEIARTRALENRVYVALCTRAGDAVAACLIGPDGGVTGSALRGCASGFVGVLDTILARRKELVPGTQTFADRMPSSYRWLDRSASAGNVRAS
jgi:hypothetical protein